jgi:hypothetical protein
VPDRSSGSSRRKRRERDLGGIEPVSRIGPSTWGCGRLAA